MTTISRFNNIHSEGSNREWKLTQIPKTTPPLVWQLTEDGHNMAYINQHITSKCLILI
jgi:hypothetical protein